MEIGQEASTKKPSIQFCSSKNTLDKSKEIENCLEFPLQVFVSIKPVKNREIKSIITEVLLY